MIRTEAPYIPNHEKQVIWDTNSPSKVPQIFEIANLGYKQILKSPKISRIPRIFAFYDTNVGKNIINALNVRVL